MYLQCRLSRGFQRQYPDATSGSRSFVFWCDSFGGGSSVPFPFLRCASLEDNISVLLGTDKINFDEFFKSPRSWENGGIFPEVVDIKGCHEILAFKDIFNILQLVNKDDTYLSTLLVGLVSGDAVSFSLEWQQSLAAMQQRYCWWKKSWMSWYGRYFIICRVS